MYLFYCPACDKRFEYPEESAPEGTAACPTCGELCVEPGFAQEQPVPPADAAKAVESPASESASPAAAPEVDVAPDEDAVPVGEYETAAEAQLICTLLGERGIRAFVDREHYMLGWNSMSLQGVARLPRVLVARHDEAAARQLLTTAHLVEDDDADESDATDVVSFLCDECGALVTLPGNRRGSVGECPACGERVDVPE